MFGGTDLYFYHYPVFIADKDSTRIRFRNPDDDTKYHDVICDSNGIRFLKNGLPHGETDKIPILTPDGTKYQHFINGIFVGITDF